MFLGLNCLPMLPPNNICHVVSTPSIHFVTADLGSSNLYYRMYLPDLWGVISRKAHSLWHLSIWKDHGQCSYSSIQRTAALGNYLKVGPCSQSKLFREKETLTCSNWLRETVAVTEVSICGGSDYTKKSATTSILIRMIFWRMIVVQMYY